MVNGGVATLGWPNDVTDAIRKGGIVSKIDSLLAEEGAAAENYETPEQLPKHVTVSKPNLGRGTVVSVRLSAEEHDQLQRAAEEANLPVSTLTGK